MTTLTEREATEATHRRDAQQTGLCAIDGCGGRLVARGLCNKHYERWRKHGDPAITLISYTRGTPEERFWPKVDPCRTDGCMVWTGSTKDGYGEFWRATDDTSTPAHHFLKGAPPAGLHSDHLCRNRACVNPDHIEFVTPRENILRGVGMGARNAQKTHCPNGHPYSAVNTYVYKRTRRCWICIQAREALRRQTRQAAKEVLA